MRIGQRFESPHDFVSVTSPLGFDERSHVASGAVLGLERAVVAVDDQLDDLVDETRVLVDSSLVVEALGDDEVQVAVLSMAKDDRVVVVVLAEKLGQVERTVGQAFDGKSDILDDDSGSGLAHRTNGGKHACTNFPEERLLGSGVSKHGGLEQLESADRV